MDEMASQLGISTPMMISGIGTILLVSAWFLVQQESQRRKTASSMSTNTSAGKASKTAQVDKSKYPGGQITIYYGTQTGTAESFAQQLEREGPDHGFLIHVVDMEDVSTEDIVSSLTETKAYGTDGTSESRAIVLVATYGEGEPTDNSNAVVQALKSAMGEEEGEEKQSEEYSSLLQDLDFCVFGLGNRQYEQFNAMGKFFDRSLQALGGQRISPLGLGDDDADLEGDFETWKDQLWAALEQKYSRGSDLERIKRASAVSANDIQLPDCEYSIEYLPKGTKAEAMRNPDQVHGSSKPYFASSDCPVTCVRELRSTQDGGSTKHVEIDISKADWKYTTADNLGVLAWNKASVVESVAKSLAYDLDAVFELKAANGHDWHGAPFPMPLTVRDCLTKYLDLTSAPRRSDLKLLTQYATDPLDRKALLRLSSKEGKVEYKQKVMEGYVGMVDLLKLCPSLSIPLEHFVSVCHFLLPRFYTIASSSTVHPKSIHLTVSVTKDTRKDGSVFEGLCSSHLAGLDPNRSETVRAFNRPSTFRLPQNSSKPILMIGPGTGVAPMRALLQERAYQKQVLKQAVGKNVLYFGCKKRSLDYLYEEEFSQWQQDGTLSELHLAFSREQPTKKVYVQHLLLEQSKATWELVGKQGASIFVCGGVKMGNDVAEALKEVIVKEGEMSFDHAKDYLAELAKAGRFVQELWA